MAWQLLFVFGAWCALGGAQADVAHPVVAGHAMGAASSISSFAFYVTLTWYVPQMSHWLPRRLEQWMYPIDKTDLDVLRFAHFLALAALTVHFLPKDLAGAQIALAAAADPVRTAFAGDLLPRRVPRLCRPLRPRRRWRRCRIARACQPLRILIMWGVAWLISWYKHEADKGASAKGARRQRRSGGRGLMRPGYWYWALALLAASCRRPVRAEEAPQVVTSRPPCSKARASAAQGRRGRKGRPAAQRAGDRQPIVHHRLRPPPMPIRRACRPR